MPRNSSGVYQLPAGNPVVSGTLIESVWANSTMADMAQALSDSLDRFGRSTMAAPFLANDGTVSAPGIAFGAESSTGLYRKAAKVLAVTVGGVEVLDFTQAAILALKPLSAPGITSSGDLTVTGNISATGTINSSGLTVTGNISATGTINGSFGAITTSGDVTLADDKQLKWGDGSAFIKGNGATDVVTIGGINVAVPALHTNGSTYGALGVRDGAVYGGTGPDANYDGIVIESNGSTGLSILSPATVAPAIVFGRPGAPMAGVVQYDHTNDILRLYTGTTQRVTVGLGGIGNSAAYYAGADSPSTPGYAWTGDAGTGMFHLTAGQIGFSAAGNECMRMANSGLFLNQSAVAFVGLVNSAAYLTLCGGSSTSGVARINITGSTYPSAPKYISLLGDVIQFLNSAGPEYARFDSAGNFLVGETTSQNILGGRSLIAVNGAANSFFGLDVGGVNKSYLYTEGTNTFLNNVNTAGAVQLQVGGVVKLKVTNAAILDPNNQEIGWKDIAAVATDTANNAALTRGAMHPVTASFTLAQQVTNGTYCFINVSGSNSAITITPAAGLTLYLAGTMLTGVRTVPARGFVTIWFNTPTSAFVMGNVS